MYARAELKAIAEWARKHEIWLIADEIYRRIHFGPGPAPSVLDLPDELLERVVMVSGASKAYAMTGWRIGIALDPALLAKAMAGVQSHTTSGASQVSQWAAVVAFGDDRVEQDLARMVDAFRARRDLVEGHFRRVLPGVEFVEPVGAFYFFFRVDFLLGGEMRTATDFCDVFLLHGFHHPGPAPGPPDLRRPACRPEVTHSLSTYPQRSTAVKRRRSDAASRPPTGFPTPGSHQTGCLSTPRRIGAGGAVLDSGSRIWRAETEP